MVGSENTLHLIVTQSSFIRIRLTHQSRETLEGSGNTNVRVDLDQDILGSVDVDLQETSLVQGTVQKGQQALFSERTEDKNYVRRHAGLLKDIFLGECCASTIFQRIH